MSGFLNKYIRNIKVGSRDTVDTDSGSNFEPVRLTQLSHGSGCGCKLSPTELNSILAQAFPEGEKEEEFPNLIIGNETKDDAAVYDLGRDEFLVSTTDFFTPIVDDAYQYGRIAAANALSDVWAMGGRPIMALAILGWPVEDIDPAVARPIIAGGRDLCREIGIPLAGGHSIDSKEPFFGLVVNGLVSRDRLRTNAGAKDGDIVFLTKPLGTGLLTTAEKHGTLRSKDEGLAVSIMGQLNDVGYDLSGITGVHALTDVTGFGLAGHLLEMCDAAGLEAELDWGALHFPTDLSRYVAVGALAKGLKNNWLSYGKRISTVVEPVRSILCDPQTGGGLLVAVDPAFIEEVQKVLKENGLADYINPIATLRTAGDTEIAINVKGHESVPEIRSFFGLDAVEGNMANAEFLSEVEKTTVSHKENPREGVNKIPDFNASCTPPEPAGASVPEMIKMMRGFFKDLWNHRKDIKKQNEWIKKYAERNGYKVNPHWMMNVNLRLWLVESEESFGERYCPCFEPSDDKILNKQIICPCKFIDQDIEEKGTCHCGLFGREDLTSDEFKEAEGRLMREYRVNLKERGAMIDTTSIPTDPFRGLKIPDAYHLAKRALMLKGAPVDIYVERDFEASNIKAWAAYKGISAYISPEGNGFKVTLGGLKKVL